MFDLNIKIVLDFIKIINADEFNEEIRTEENSRKD